MKYKIYYEKMVIQFEVTCQIILGNFLGLFIHIIPTDLTINWPN